MHASWLARRDARRLRMTGARGARVTEILVEGPEAPQQRVHLVFPRAARRERGDPTARVADHASDALRLAAERFIVLPQRCAVFVDHDLERDIELATVGQDSGVMWRDARGGPG
jgi:hypothetical protein